MEWLTDFLKHLAISRALVGAVFLTSVVMFVGPIYSPQIVPSVPQPWSSALFGTMVLSCTLLLFWGIAGFWSFVVQRLSVTSATLSAASLTQIQVDLIHVMGHNPSKPLDLESINYGRVPYTRLEIGQLMRDLQQKGLVSINDWDENLVSLTNAGRERALEIQRNSKAQSTV